MPKTTVNCPNCRQLITADVHQLFDVGTDPSVKQQVLTGVFNFIECPHCGYQGNLATPIVYHDPEKELLLTYFPPELGLPVNEQERIIGPLINQVMNSLPQEKRKAYLLRPQTMLTLQTLVEKVLEADGITKEMIQAQQQRLNLLQRLLSVTSDDAIEEIARQEDKLIDADFFNLASRLAEAAMAGGDSETAQKMEALQRKLISVTSFGKEFQSQSKEIEAAVKSLQSLGSGLTREKLLDLLIDAPNETRLNVLVSLARQGMDYQFFQILTDRIDKAPGAKRDQLLGLREKLLTMTREIDQQLQARAAQSGQLLEQVLKEADVTAAIQQVLPEVDEFFIQALNSAFESARRNGDLERISKLQKVQEVLQQASQPSKEMELVEELLDIEDEQELEKAMQAHQDEFTSEFMDMMGGLMAQMESNQDPELAERLQKLYQKSLRFSMRANLK